MRAVIDGPHHVRHRGAAHGVETVIAALRLSPELVPGAHLEPVDDDPESPIFYTPAGGRLRLSNFRGVFDRARTDAGLPEWVTPYTLRHTAASLMAQQGVPATAASALLGHDPAIFLRTYAHLYPDDLRAASAALDDARQEAVSAAAKDRAGRLRTLRDAFHARGWPPGNRLAVRPAPPLTCTGVVGLGRFELPTS